MERNTCYLALTVAEAARTVSQLVEKDGLTSKMADCHELRQGDALRGMVLIFEKYFIRAGSRLTMTAVLDNLEGPPGSTGRSPAATGFWARAARARRRRRSTARPCGRSCSPTWPERGGPRAAIFGFPGKTRVRRGGEAVLGAPRGFRV